MNLMINTATTHKGGGVQVARSFIEECRHHPAHRYHVVLGELLSNLIEDSAFPENFFFYRIGKRPASGLLSMWSAGRYFKKLEDIIDPDVVFTTSGPSYWRPRSPHLAGYNLPHYIYRDSPFFNKISVMEQMKWSIKGELIRQFYKRDTDAVVVQTEDVNQRVKKWLNTERVFTVSNTFSHFYELKETCKNRLPERKPGEFRFLTLSAWYPHKNLCMIRNVIDHLPETEKNEIRFVLTLPEEIFLREFPKAYRTFIYNTGPVPPQEGPSLYRECDAIFLPTLLECFSASYAEAMVMEKPVITSDLGFAKTVCEDAAIYADPVSADDFAEKILELYRSRKKQEMLIKMGKERVKAFSNAAKRAQQYLAICKQLMDER